MNIITAVIIEHKINFKDVSHNIIKMLEKYEMNIMITLKRYDI